ncbi:hypothetical protein PVNG_06301 [Plasmodium vivax North Korean]|uniref:Variable surface protein Vir7-like protein n=1 Tax=Plasmodium vivax North Korean TaxID=1035514 RepID=A0A0J9TKZ9_PLAVI|nr:hypothetical protein PVNG_06301 [Plasmodium vivax North Korean]
MLRTKHYYYYFDNEIGVCDGDIFNDKAKEILDKHPELKGVSEKVLKALCYVHSKSMISGFDKDICDFLYYWIGDKILNGLTKKQFFEEIMLTLFKSLNDSGTRKICDFHYNNIYAENFQNIKLIFDYSEDYNSYEKQITGRNTPCNQDYKKYLETYVNSFKIFYDKCTVQQLNYNYCEAFKKYFYGKNTYLLSTWTCDLKINDSRDIEFKEKEEVEDDADTETQLEEASPRSLMDTQHRLSSQIFSSGREALATVPGMHDSTLDGETSIINSNGSSSERNSSTITSKSITGAVSVAGALVPSYLLYNYTPAGNMINKLLGRKTTMNYNPLTEAQLIDNFSHPGSFTSERSRYNVAYRPV